jgi:putative NADH-flavin reductase
MRILVFGATGPTGTQVISQALGRGHSVTAFVRDRAKLSVKDERLLVEIGDAAQDATQVAEAVGGQDTVIGALGVGASFRSGHLIERCMQIIVPAMEQAGVRRLILLSAFGVGASSRDAPLIPRIFFRTLLREVFADKLAAEELVRQSRLEWTFVYPVMLTSGPLTEKYRAGERLELHGMSRISRADVAHFILEEAQKGAFVGKAAVVSY